MYNGIRLAEICVPVAAAVAFGNVFPIFHLLAVLTCLIGEAQDRLNLLRRLRPLPILMNEVRTFLASPSISRSYSHPRLLPHPHPHPTPMPTMLHLHFQSASELPRLATGIVLPISLLLRAVLLLPIYSDLFDENPGTPTATTALAACMAASGVLLILWELISPPEIELAADADAEAQVLSLA